MIRRLLAVTAAALALAAPAAAACTQPRTSLSYLEGQIMCPTCRTTLDQSDAPAALRIEAQIQKRIAQCWTADQIEAELVRNFGAGILAAPPKKGFDLLAWWLPLGGVILGAGLLAFGVWRWSRRGEGDGDGEPPSGGDRGSGGGSGLDTESERRLDEALARYD